MMTTDLIAMINSCWLKQSKLAISDVVDVRINNNDRAQEGQKGIHSQKEQPVVRIVDASEVMFTIVIYRDSTHDVEILIECS